jgi:hypothetical protein
MNTGLLIDAAFVWQTLPCFIMAVLPKRLLKQRHGILNAIVSATGAQSPPSRFTCNEMGSENGNVSCNV